MKQYRVSLNRAYFVFITAEDRASALQLAEYYVGSGRDESSKEDQVKHNFSISDIELVINEAMEVVKEAN